jgi:hypothetical protein
MPEGMTLRRIELADVERARAERNREQPNDA